MWELLKQKGINCESRKSAKELFAYGGKEPLPALGTSTADFTLAGFENGSKADFVVVEGNGRTLWMSFWGLRGSAGRDVGMDFAVGGCTQRQRRCKSL